MSDFDKEAEREKLREQYERDEKKREATEQMSELLLKGATMTNTHCGTCGDPIFRYEGQEFCPTCQEVVTDPDAAAAADAEEAAERANGDAGESEGEGATEADGTTADRTDERTSAGAPETTVRSERESARPPADEAATPADRPSTEPAGTPVERPSRDADARPQSAPSRADAPAAAADATATRSAEGGPTESLATARASLTRTVSRLARRAESAEDLERVRAYLAATEEAAEALDAVERADR